MITSRAVYSRCFPPLTQTEMDSFRTGRKPFLVVEPWPGTPTQIKTATAYFLHKKSMNY